MKLKHKILIVLLVAFTIFIYIVFNYPKAEPEVFLIPKDYRGEVLVVYNQSFGENIEYEGKNRIYRIPETGVLFTQFEYNPGVIEQKYYFVNKNIREEIEYRPFMDDRDKYINQPNKVGITRELTDFYGSDSCLLKTDQLIVTSHNDYPNYNCRRRMLEIADTICP